MSQASLFDEPAGDYEPPRHMVEFLAGFVAGVVRPNEKLKPKQREIVERACADTLRQVAYALDVTEAVGGRVSSRSASAIDSPPSLPEALSRPDGGE